MTIQELEKEPPKPASGGTISIRPIQVLGTNTTVDDETGLRILNPNYWRTVRPDAHLGAVSD